MKFVTRSTIGLLGGTIFFSWSLIRTYGSPYSDEFSRTERCELTVYPYLPVIFLTCAVLLNVNKWLYCLLYIRFYSKGANEVDPRQT